MAVQRKYVYRRLPLEHLGSENCISEHTILRAHDRSLPLMIKMFFSNNYGKRSFAATETKVGKKMEFRNSALCMQNIQAGSGFKRNPDPEVIRIC
jgi:hypothetical protein